MRDRNWFEAVLDDVQNLELLQSSSKVQNPSFLELGLNEEGIIGKLKVEDIDVSILLRLPVTFPMSLPVFSLIPAEALGLIPHVDNCGTICYISTEGKVFDQNKPVQLIKECFELAIEVLSKGIKKDNLSDFADEFEVYWRTLPPKKYIKSYFEPGYKVAEVDVVTDLKEKNFFLGSLEEFVDFNNGRTPESKYLIQKGLYIPLEDNSFVQPPQTNKPFWTATEAKKVILSGISESNVRKLKKLLKRHRPFKHIVLKIPRSSTGFTLIGFEYDSLEKGYPHPILQGGKNKTLTPFIPERLEYSYLVSRGGADKMLKNKRVLLIGCGAVGGHIAFELIRAGIIDLTLIDSDFLREENTFRHVLGRNYWGQKKVFALKTEIENEYPYIKVTPFDLDVETMMLSGKVKLEVFDLIIVALGNPTIELQINRQIHNLPKSPAAIFTWLEPLGVGGHALLTNVELGPGCFDCLYSDLTSTNETLNNRASFAAKDQFFGRALSGCGTFHTPYGSIHATKTAVMATELALEYLTNQERRNPLISWKGKPDEFLKNGFLLSNRFKFTEKEIYDGRYAYINPHCTVCSSTNLKAA